MENNIVNNIVDPPSKVFNRVVYFSEHPVIYDFMLFLDFNSKGNSILGCSNFGTLWEGTLLYFNNPSDLLSLKFNKNHISSTTSDGKFINDYTVAVCEDNCILNIFSTNTENDKLESKQCFRYMDPIAQLSVWHNNNVVTSSGTTINVWDIENKERTPIHKFTNIHTNTINSVDCIKNDKNCFLSAASDKKCCLWDLRSKKPPQVVFAHEFCSLCSVACNQDNSNYMIIGTEGGHIYSIDKRQPLEFLTVYNINNKVHRISYNSENKFAICSDSNDVIILKLDEDYFKKIYSNNNHSEFVRGLSWYENDLYSCGFDKKVFKHTNN